MSDRQPAFETLQIHAGNSPDPATGARQVPIYQSTAFVFRDADHAAALFNLQEVGWIYSRLTNPTVAALAERITALEGGVGGICCSSGHAAQIMALFPLMMPGCNVVASTRLYGGTYTQLTQTIKRFGWSARLVDFDDLDAVKAAIDDDTRAIFCESIANPGGYITDLDAIGKIANEAGVPLIVDNTSATPYLCRPIEHGATLVVNSTHEVPHRQRHGHRRRESRIRASSTGRHRASSRPCPSPNPPITGSPSTPLSATMAFTFHSIAVGLRDLGMTMNPQGAHYTLMGIESRCRFRMEKHVANAVKVAQVAGGRRPDRDASPMPVWKAHPTTIASRASVPKGAGALVHLRRSRAATRPA